MRGEELRRRVLDGIGPEIELFGSCSPDSAVLRPAGVVASVSPATPDRSLFNSVFADGPAELAAVYEELAAAYVRAGVRAWTVWVRDDDAASAALLAERGHVLDSNPRAMALDLDDLQSPATPVPDGVSLVEASALQVGRINDLAYEFSPGWQAAFRDWPSEPRSRALAAVVGDEAVSCAVVVESGDDACITAVATLPGHRGRGLAATIVSELLSAARDDGSVTGSLQASRAGSPVYERLGFTDVGHLELWERREG